MTAHRIEAVLERDGSLSLDHLPLRAGDKVEVIILVDASPAEASNGHAESYPLRGKEPYQFVDAFSPAVSADDWDALR